MKQALRPPFHLAFPVHDLACARDFYGRLLGCPEGRSSDLWVDFDLMGHQIVAHLAPGQAAHGAAYNPVDGAQTPVRHFGLVLEWQQWHALVEKLRAAGAVFSQQPGVRFAGQPGEQATFFISDPSGNALEFKSFRNPESLFAK